MQIFLSLIYVLMLFIVFLYPGFVFLTETYRGTHPEEPVPMRIKVFGWIPVFNTLHYYTIMYNKQYLKFTTLAAFLLCAILRGLALTVLINSPLFLIITSVLDTLFILYIWFISAWTYFDMAKLVECSGVTKILCFVAPPVGAYLVGKKIRPFMKNQKDVVQETFIHE